MTDLAAAIADNPEAAWRELDLADARDSLLDFCGMIEIPGAPIGEEDEATAFQPIVQPAALHHRILIALLERVERGDCRRAMIFMPPGSAKSSYASVVFPPWFMGREKRRNVIVATYASPLARKLGRRARSIVKQPVYGEIFDLTLSDESSAADEWALSNENEFMAGGILSGLTGNRADLIIIDDPIKGREEAESETIRKRTREEYEDSLKTRLKPGGRIVLIQTRWHEDDLAGSILPVDYDGESGPILCQDGEVWEVLCVPAQANRSDDPIGRLKGEYLWPEWFDESHWNSFKSNPRTWSALYQQRPSPEEGTYFQRAWFKRFVDRDPAPGQAVLPRSLRYYGTSDYAVTEGGGDWTVLRVWGIDQDLNAWLVDGWRGRTASDAWVEAQIDLMARYRPNAFLGEAGVIQKAMEPALARRMRERGVACRLRWLSSTHDKPTRARGIQDRAARGRVFIRDDSDGDFVLSEYVAFPAGKHDDEVDNASLIGRFLDELSGPARKDRATKADTMNGIDDY